MAEGGWEEALRNVSLCTGCKECEEACPTYSLTRDPSLSPVGRLEAAAKVLEGGDGDQDLVRSLYSCTKCGLCEYLCPSGVKITKVVHEGRCRLVALGKAPLPAQEKIVDGILKYGNSVNGDPAARLDWLPEPFPAKESQRLLFVGCLPSYLVTEVARSSFLLLRRLGVDFTILEEEGCCGIYPYEAGMVDVALEIFRDKAERFSDLGIDEVIVPCNGCFKAFKYYYPEVLGEAPVRVRHLLEVVYEQWQQGELPREGGGEEVTYQDPCRLSRGEGLHAHAREIVKRWGFELKEPPWSPAEGPCCGGGAGVRSLYRDLSLEMALRVLDDLPASTVVTACPFCTFNLTYASKKGGRNKAVHYFAALLLDSISS